MLANRRAGGLTARLDQGTALERPIAPRSHRASPIHGDHAMCRSRLGRAEQNRVRYGSACGATPWLDYFDYFKPSGGFFPAQLSILTAEVHHRVPPHSHK
jgi:hypothetical protein